MKYQQNLFIFYVFIYTFIGYNQLSAVLTMSQYKPDSSFQKPYFTQDYFTNIECNLSGGFANHAYNNQHTQVPFLQQFGTEDLLNRFIDPALPNNDIQNIGQGVLDGNFHVRELILSCYKNITKGFFIEGATVIQNLFINTITINFASTQTPLTNEQINYLQELQKQLPFNLDRSGMFTTAVYTGFHKTFLNFTHLDFIDLQIKAGIMSPQAMTYNFDSLLQFPFIGNYNFGYPIITTATVGVLDWLTIGANTAIIPWQAANATIPMNNSLSQNSLLITEAGVAIIQKGALFTTAIYLEADHFYQGLSTTFGYCYTANSSMTITPINQVQFPKALVNRSPLLDGWSLGSLYVQFDIDFACEITPSAPVITLFCNIPIAGKLCPQTNIFGGSCNLQLSYAF